ncbi:MAG: mraZ [Puniceicoccaceae bacterium MED-G30]|jgi:MraZ protein|nr:MAG: mraZ [Puniceicoccaceae bacterium MED-G30]RPG86173.1 MAG: mraZ [Coraliomargarita sp. TMED73]
MGRSGSYCFNYPFMPPVFPSRFVGVKRHNIDQKGRLTIPSAWRPGMDSKENFFLALPNPAGFVTVYPPKMIAQLEERISQISMGDMEAQQALTDLMTMAHSFSCDKQGRINLNDELLSFAKIRKGAVLVGKLTSFSIYSDAAFDAMQGSGGADPSTQAAIFKQFGL